MALQRDQIERNQLISHLLEQKNQDQIIENLRKFSFLINTPNNCGIFPIQIALRKGNFQIFQEIVDLGADLQILNKNNQTVIYIASFYGRLKELQVLLQGQSVDHLQQDNRGFSPLMAAVNEEHYEVVDLLLDYQFDLIQENKMKKNVFDLCKSQEMFNLLFKKTGLDFDEFKQIYRIPLKLIKEYQQIQEKQQQLTPSNQIFSFNEAEIKKNQNDQNKNKFFLEEEDEINISPKTAWSCLSVVGNVQSTNRKINNEDQQNLDEKNQNQQFKEQEKKKIKTPSKKERISNDRFGKGSIYGEEVINQQSQTQSIRKSSNSGNNLLGSPRSSSSETIITSVSLNQELDRMLKQLLQKYKSEMVKNLDEVQEIIEKDKIIQLIDNFCYEFYDNQKKELSVYNSSQQKEKYRIIFNIAEKLIEKQNQHLSMIHKINLISQESKIKKQVLQIKNSNSDQSSHINNQFPLKTLNYNIQTQNKQNCINHHYKQIDNQKQ